MISLEFKVAVSEKNLLRTRIMLKDSFVVDPTLEQLSEMLSYAKKYLPDLMVSYDGDYLEEDSSKWSSETMNEELVQLVTNFSDIRVNHLEKVVSKILAEEAEIIKRKKLVKNKQNSCAAQHLSAPPTRSSLNSFVRASDSKKVMQRELLAKEMIVKARKINEVINEVCKNNNKWNPKNVDDLERTAQEILKAVRKYKENK